MHAPKVLVRREGRAPDGELWTGAVLTVLLCLGFFLHPPKHRRKQRLLVPMPDETHHIAISFPKGIAVSASIGDVFGKESSDHVFVPFLICLMSRSGVCLASVSQTWLLFPKKSQADGGRVSKQ